MHNLVLYIAEANREMLNNFHTNVATGGYVKKKDNIFVASLHLLISSLAFPCFGDRQLS